MSSLVLYNYFRSSTSYRTRIALYHKGLNFEYKPVSLLKGEQHSAEYRKMNPVGGVPTLVHDGKIIPDSYAIIEYLEETFPQHPLLPKDPYIRARIREVCQIITAFMHPMGNLKLQQYLEAKAGYQQPQKEEWVQHWTMQGLASLEITLKEFAGQYCFGDNVTMADLFLIPQIVTCKRFHVDTSKYPLLMRIYENCVALPAFEKAHPFRQIDTPEDMRIP